MHCHILRKVLWWDIFFTFLNTQFVFQCLYNFDCRGIPSSSLIQWLPILLNPTLLSPSRGILLMSRIRSRATLPRPRILLFHKHESMVLLQIQLATLQDFCYTRSWLCHVSNSLSHDAFCSVIIRTKPIKWCFLLNLLAFYIALWKTFAAFLVLAFYMKKSTSKW